MNSEVRRPSHAVAALQLTNLYKKGLENTHDALQSGYALALRDTLDYVRGQGASRTAADLERYLSARLEALRHDADEAAETRPTATPSARRARPAAAHELTTPGVVHTPTRASRAERHATKPRPDEIKAPRRDVAYDDEPASDATPDSASLRPRKRLRGAVRRRSETSVEPSTQP